jgi:hypothetical protein
MYKSIIIGLFGALGISLCAFTGCGTSVSEEVRNQAISQANWTQNYSFSGYSAEGKVLLDSSVTFDFSSIPQTRDSIQAKSLELAKYADDHTVNCSEGSVTLRRSESAIPDEEFTFKYNFS